MSHARPSVVSEEERQSIRSRVRVEDAKLEQTALTHLGRTKRPLTSPVLTEQGVTQAKEGGVVDHVTPRPVSK